MTHKLSIDFNLLPTFTTFDKVSFNADGKILFQTILFLQQNNITFQVHDWYGPAGGINYITFFGTYESLKKFLEKVEFYDYEYKIQTI